MGSRSETLAGPNGDTGGLSPGIQSECLAGSGDILVLQTIVILIGQIHDSLKGIYSGCQRGA